jgi:hypothetical protein
LIRWWRAWRLRREPVPEAQPEPPAEPPDEEPVEAPAPDIKGNEATMLFHTTESPYYARVRADVWFESEDEARAAGYSRWDER